MGKFGIKIKNFDAKSVYFNNVIGQKKYKCTDGMLANSLFLDFLKNNGLKTDEKTDYTRDIVCIDFKQLTNASKNEKDNLNYQKRMAESKFEELKEELNNKIEDLHAKFEAGEIYKDEENRRIDVLKEKIAEAKDKKELAVAELEEEYKFIIDNEGKVPAKSMLELRTDFYKNGVDIVYDDKTIHYKMLYRSSGKAKDGSCMFIREPLHKRALAFLRMGMKLPKKNFPIVEMGAYSSLVASTIAGRIKIDPRRILVIKDVTTTHDSKVITVDKNSEGKCITELVEKYPVESTLFDGQALIDKSLFEQAVFDDPDEKGNGYLLLRHHFCKMAAFNANIQDFFKDYCAENALDYDAFKVKDYWDNEHFAKDIQLITTENAMKWSKDVFGVTFEQWCQKVGENGNIFGIVKTAHESKFGKVQRMSYQMVNALEANSDFMKRISQCTLDYIEDLNLNNEGALINFLEKFKADYNDYEVLLNIIKKNPDFVDCDYFRDRKYDIVEKLTKEARQGRLFQNGDNLVIVGSPYAMLLAAAGVDIKNNPDKDVTFKSEKDSIQCYTERFSDGEYLAEFRSPFNGKNNLGYLHNVKHPLMQKYFNFGNLIIAVNLMGTDFQARNNGSDQDSDQIFTTNQPDIVDCARKYYEKYPTIVNKIKPVSESKNKNEKSKEYCDTLADFAAVDNDLAKAKQATGEASNLAQLCLTYTYNFPDDDLKDKVCALSVLSQLAIDNAKKQYDINITSAISKIRNEIKIQERGFPVFWANVVDSDFERTQTRKTPEKQYKIEETLRCPMNSINLKPKIHKLPRYEISKVLYLEYQSFSTRKAERFEKPVEEYMDKLAKAAAGEKGQDEEDELYSVLNADYKLLLEKLKKIIADKNLDFYAWILDRGFCASQRQENQKNRRKGQTYKNRPILLKVLYDLDRENVLSLFHQKS